MISLVLTAVSAVFLAVYDLFKKISLRNKNNVYEVLFFFCFIAFLCSFLFIRQAFSVGIVDVLFLLLKSCVISVSWFLTAKALSKLDMSIVVPFTLLGVVFTTILARIFFDEHIGYVEIGGIGIILIGLFMLSKLNEKNIEKKNNYLYLILLVIACFLSSVSAIIDKKLLTNIDKGPVLFYFFGFLSLIYFFVYLFKNKKIDIKGFTNNLWVIGVGVCIFLSDLFYYIVVSNNDISLSIISIVKKLSVFIDVVLASVFLKEKYFLKKILILVLMFVGVGALLIL